MTNKKRPNSEKNKEQREREREKMILSSILIFLHNIIFVSLDTSLLKGVRQGNYIVGEKYTR